MTNDGQIISCFSFYFIPLKPEKGGIAGFSLFFQEGGNLIGQR